MVSPPDYEDNQAHAEYMAELITEKLRTKHFIPAEFPSAVGEWIRTLNHETEYRTIQTIPIGGQYNTPRFHVDFLANGGIHLIFTDLTGQIFWQGTLLPVDQNHAQ